MNVCFCAHRLPYPPLAGGKRETFKLVEGLAAAGHAVDFVTYADDPARVEAMAEAVGCRVHAVSGLPDRTAGNLLGNLVSLDPLPVTKTDTAPFRATVQEQARDADVVHLHALQTSFLAAEDDLAAPTVVRFNNVKYEIYRQFARYTDNPAKAAYAYLQYLKTRRYERSVPDATDLTLTITAMDRERVTTPGTTGRIEVLPAGVDPAEFDLLDHDPDSRVVTFFGSMDYHPNDDAVRWFVRKVLPTIRDRQPDVTFEVVGKDPSPALRSLAEERDVRVTGFVDDLGDHVARAAVVVLPIRVGTGIRMKALHAMAMGKPLVSTPLGTQGIAVSSGHHASIAESADEFAESVLELLADPQRQQEYRRNARALVEREHDWPTITRQLTGFYEEVLAGG